jgi:sec-independent protein translocase protein TatA
MGIHWQELIVILLIVLVLFGPKRLPEMGASLGKGIRGFQEGLRGIDRQTSDAVAASTVTEVATPAVPAPVELVEPAAEQSSATDN